MAWGNRLSSDSIGVRFGLQQKYATTLVGNFGRLPLISVYARRMHEFLPRWPEWGPFALSHRNCRRLTRPVSASPSLGPAGILTRLSRTSRLLAPWATVADLCGFSILPPDTLRTVGSNAALRDSNLSRRNYCGLKTILKNNIFIYYTGASRFAHINRILLYRNGGMMCPLVGNEYH